MDKREENKHPVLRFLMSHNGTILLSVALLIAIALLILAAKLPPDALTMSLDLSEILALILAIASLCLSLILHYRSQSEQQASSLMMSRKLEESIKHLENTFAHSGSHDTNSDSQPPDNPDKQALKTAEQPEPTKPNIADLRTRISFATDILRKEVLNDVTNTNLSHFLTLDDESLLKELHFYEKLSDDQIRLFKEVEMLKDDTLTAKGSQFIRSLIVMYLQYH
ncbi:MAG: hypothetical protein IJ087_04405 [Eggerthellaceae bacterium]|nr:hypothetical protein [Eggerthellaceae bacterium]